MMKDYRAHLVELRQCYIEATPRQRFHIASQRINPPEHGPNLLVAYVSAIEGFARSLALHQEAPSKTALSVMYPKYKNMKAARLIEQFLKKKINKAPEDFFDKDIWEKVGFAIEYRNLLAHECTYLGQDTYPDLIEAYKSALKKLAELEGINTKQA
jgi:hypothetical protein